MSVAEGQRPANIISRVQNILLRPSAEWDVIDAEPATTQSLILGYAAIVAAIPAIGRLVWGFEPHCFSIVIASGCVAWNPAFVVASAIAYYLVALVGVFLVGLIIDALAPSFEGAKSPTQAMKVAVYSCTAGWLAGALVIVPWVGGLLSLFGLYSLYLLYLGLPRLMKAPQDKALGYTAVVVILAIVVFLIAGAVAGSVAAMGAIGGNMMSPAAPATGTLRLGGATVDLGKMEAAAKQMEAASRRAKEGGGEVQAVDPQRLKALLPDNLAGAPRTEVEAASGGAGGMNGSNARAVYEAGARRITLSVTDLAAAGAFTAMAGAINVNTDKETPSGYEKVSTVGGRLTTERYDNQDRSGEYSILVGNRFHISAEGSGVSMDDLKAAVAAVGPDRVAAMANG